MFEPDWLVMTECGLQLTNTEYVNVWTKEDPWRNREESMIYMREKNNLVRVLILSLCSYNVNVFLSPWETNREKRGKKKESASIFFFVSLINWTGIERKKKSKREREREKSKEEIVVVVVVVVVVTVSSSNRIRIGKSHTVNWLE